MRADFHCFALQPSSQTDLLADITGPMRIGLADEAANHLEQSLYIMAEHRNI